MFFGATDGILAFPLRGSGSSNRIVFYRTTNGGRTWTPTTGVADTLENWNPVWNFVNTSDGFVVDGRVLQITTNGGERWAAVHPNVGLSGVSDLDFLTP